MNPQPSPLTLILAAAGVVIVVCGAVVAALLLVRDVPSSDVSSTVAVYPFEAGTQPYPEPEVVTETFTEPETTTETTTTEAAPVGYEQVTGPGGMTTYIPSGWPTKTATGPGAMQADDPSGALLLRYGGSTTSELDTYQVHEDYEGQFAANRSGYSRLRLDRSTVRGMSAVDWEFEYDPQGDARRHIRSVYWLSQGYEYFVYVSAPVDQWSTAQEILDVMLDNATP